MNILVELPFLGLGLSLGLLQFIENMGFRIGTRAIFGRMYPGVDDKKESQCR